MSDKNSEVVEGLLQAIKAERDGHSFYLMAAAGTKDPKGKEIFEILANEELAHMHYLHAQYKSILATGHVDRSASLGPRADLGGMSPIFSDNLKSRVKGAHIEMSALSIGIQLEQDAIAFYNSQAQKTNDPEIKDFFSTLADWETGHYQALLNQQEELKQDYWSESGFAPF